MNTLKIVNTLIFVRKLKVYVHYGQCVGLYSLLWPYNVRKTMSVRLNQTVNAYTVRIRV